MSVNEDKNVPISKSMVAEGDFVMFVHEDDGIMAGRIEYVMTNPGLLGLPGSEYSMEYAEDDKPVIVRAYKEEDGAWEEQAYVFYHRMSEVIKIESLSVSVDMVVEMGSNGTGIPSMPQQSDLENMYAVQVSKSYNSDNQDEDKWDNMTKACWVGYTQRGMKDKGGRMVPNCVPVGKLENMEDEMQKAKKPNYSEIIKPRSGGSTPSNPKLYATVVQAAKDKFEVYPSAVANSWVVQEYKRRGGTYKSESQSTTKNIWGGSFNPTGIEK
jgi:DhnA family fructose-bisphosphate aldolase class Ia